MSSASAILAVTPTPEPLTTTTQVPVPEFVWSYIASDVGLKACWGVAVLCLTAILLCCRYRPWMLCVPECGLSIPIRIVFWNHLVNNAVFIFSTAVVNFVVSYNPPVIDSIKWVNTWWSFWVGNYIMAAPCAVFFVTLDRFLALKLVHKYNSGVQALLSKAALATMAALYVFSLVDVLVAWPYDGACPVPGTENNPIGNRPCLPLLNKIINYAQEVIKVVLAVANIVLGIAFLLALRAIKIQNVKNSIVRITIICEVIFDAIPGIAQLLFSALGVMINLNVYTFFAASLDAAICSGTYTWLLMKIFRSSSNIPHHQATGTQPTYGAGSAHRPSIQANPPATISSVAGSLGRTTRLLSVGPAQCWPSQEIAQAWADNARKASMRRGTIALTERD